MNVFDANNTKLFNSWIIRSKTPVYDQTGSILVKFISGGGDGNSQKHVKENGGLRDGKIVHPDDLRCDTCE